jgi:hypothetical protein
MENKRTPAWWIGTILKFLIVLFFLFDSITKIIKHPKSVEGTVQLGLPEDCLIPLGLYLFFGTLLYIYNKTSILGGVFITAYLGGAVAVTYAAQQPGHSYVFAIMFAVIMWLAEFLRNLKMRTVLPIIK